MNILVTDGESRSALAVTRSLGRKGCRVIVTGPSSCTLASASRFCALGLPVPDPLRRGEEFIRVIIEIAAREGIDFIFAMTEHSIYLLNQARALLPPGTVLASPAADKMAAVSDKAALFHLAQELGVSIPKTLYIEAPDVLAARIKEIPCYPVVVKPAYSKMRVGDGFLQGAVSYASSQAELEKLYAASPVLRHPSLIQEKIIGAGTGLFTLYDGTAHLALFSHRRLREKPPSGGVSVVAESVPLDEEMVDATGKILSAVGWDGVAMAEFKRDQRDGKAKLIEINGRFWGSLQLAISCGVDFPGLLLQHLQGNDPQFPESEYLVGHKLKWFFGTLDHLLIRLKYNGSHLNLPPDAPSKWRAVADFLKIVEKETSFDVVDGDDPRPFLLEGICYFRQLFRVRR